jgi:predicted nucleic acid-binding protein
MICVDSSTFIAFFRNDPGPDVNHLRDALIDGTAVLPPCALSELLSDRHLPEELEFLLLHMPMLPLLDGYWERTGYLRRRLLMTGRKAKLADVLIAQCCIDHGVTLLTRDADFETFARSSDLVVWRPGSR